VARSGSQFRKWQLIGMHELRIPQRTMRPSIARVSEQIDPRFAGSRHTNTQSTTKGFHPVARKLLLISHPAESKRLS